MSQVLFQKGHKGYWKGKKMPERSQEWKDKIANANRGKKRTPQQKLELSKAQKGKT